MTVAAQEEDAWIDSNTIRYQGSLYRAIDDEGVFFWEVRDPPQEPMPSTPVDLREIWGERVPAPVRVRLVDSIDATRTDHGFNETPQFPGQRPNEPSRIMNINGRNYRVTAAPAGFDLFWFSYIFTTEARPGEPHLMVVESVNDRERYNGVAITAIEKWTPEHPADGRGHWEPESWAAPYDTSYRCIPETQEGDWGTIRDVGVSVYTGREYPTDGQPYHFEFLFYPKDVTNRVTISCSGWAVPPHPDNGAAVSRIWIFALDDPPPSRPADPAYPVAGEERRVGLYFPHPWYFYGHYGVPSCTRDQRRVSLSSLLHLVRFCGMNWLEFNAINGSDRSSIAWYEGSAHFPMLQGDLFDEMSDLAEAAGVDLLPVVTSILPPDNPYAWGFTDDSFQMGSDGAFRTAFGSRAPDPLRPEVQDFLISLLHEIGSRIADRPAYKGIGFRVNGKIGLCYVASEDGTLGARTSGYSRWDLERFRADTGVEVPLTPAEAYNWLTARPDAWETWIDWRCSKMRDFWLRARDVVRSYRSDFDLYVKCVLPSEVPGTNIEWPREDAAELLRHHGLDPSLYDGEEGIFLERTMMVAEDRFFAKWGYPWGTNAERYKTFHYDGDLARSYRTPAGAAVELYHNYWEEAFHPDIEFGGFADGFRTSTPAARKRAFFEPALFSLVEAVPDVLAFMGWERPVLAHEADLRRFCMALRALPRETARDFEGTVSPSSVVARRFGERLAVFNNGIDPQDVRITLPSPLAAGKTVVDASTGRVWKTGEDPDRERIDLKLYGYDLAVLVFDPPKTIRPPGAAPLRNPGFEEDDASRVFPPRYWLGWGDGGPDGTLNGMEFDLNGSLFTPHSGGWCAGKYTNWGTTQDAGFYQTFEVTPGRTYRCEAWAWTPGVPDARPLGEVRLGVDARGGTDWLSAHVLWTDWVSLPDEWTRIGFLEDRPVEALAARLTLFLQYRQPTARPSNAMLFDDASVIPWPPVDASLSVF